MILTDRLRTTRRHWPPGALETRPKFTLQIAFNRESVTVVELQIIKVPLQLQFH